MKWLIYGILASILFGLWGFFDKLSTFLNPFTSNLIIYISAFILALTLITAIKKIKFSKYSLLAGIFAGVGNLFVLYALLKNYLILVLPFVSISSAVFFSIIYLTEKPKYTKNQKTFAFLGLVLGVIGIFIIATGSVGFFTFLKTLTLDLSYILLALIILTSFSLWTYFTYKSVATEKIDAATYSFWKQSASLTIALLAVIMLNQKTLTDLVSLSSSEYIYPILAGLCIFGGTFFTYKAFKTTTTKTKVQEAIVAVLANGELIPLAFLSYFILGERIIEGLIGTSIVLIGLILLHYGEVSK